MFRDMCVRTYVLKFVEVDMTEHTVSPATRAVDGYQVPAAGQWRIDPGHTSVEFVGRHFMLTKVRGRFTDVEGVIVVGEDPADSRVDVRIGMASVDTGFDQRDEHLRSADFFDVSRHPDASFTGEITDWTGNTAKLAGHLTIVGVARPVTLDVEYLGHASDPWGSERAVFSARTEIDREDWGLTWNMVLESGGILVSRKIQIEIEAETVFQPAGQ
jgi:polyisoprenoid-binding protein YceI